VRVRVADRNDASSLGDSSSGKELRGNATRWAFSPPAAGHGLSSSRFKERKNAITLTGVDVGAGMEPKIKLRRIGAGARRTGRRGRTFFDDAPRCGNGSVWLRTAHLRRTSGDRELRFHRERRARISVARLFLTVDQVWRIPWRMASSSRSMPRRCRSLGALRRVRAGDDRRDRGDRARESGEPITGPTQDRSTGGSRTGGSCASQRIAFQLASTLGAQSLRATGSRASSQGANSLVVQCCFPPPHAIPFRGPRDGLLRPGHSPSKARPVRETVAVPVLEGSCWVAWSSLGANLRDIT
jgi:hypothetical protein